MSKLRIDLPEETVERLKLMAKKLGLSVNKLIEEMSAQAVAAWDNEVRFRAMSATGNVNNAVAVLDRLDSAALKVKEAEPKPQP